LMFALYQTSESGVCEVAHTVSDPFEVFSPKLFRGMKESTPLTRHLAAQGLKVKLRTDTTVGRQSEARRRPSNVPASSPSSTEPSQSSSSRSPFPSSAGSNPANPSNRSLVWRSDWPPDLFDRHAGSSPQDYSKRTTLDEYLPSLPPSSSLNWARTPSADLAAFSLDQQRPPHNMPPSTSSSSRASSSRPFSPFSSYTTPSELSLQSRTSSERSPLPPMGGLHIRPGDDGIPILPVPPFSVMPSVMNLLSGPGPDGDSQQLAPIRSISGWMDGRDERREPDGEQDENERGK